MDTCVCEIAKKPKLEFGEATVEVMTKADSMHGNEI
jgi:hypothetical protein